MSQQDQMWKEEADKRRDESNTDLTTAFSVAEETVCSVCNVPGLGYVMTRKSFRMMHSMTKIDYWARKETQLSFSGTPHDIH
jgi:hypothetical protein